MQCNRRTAVLASLAFGAICAGFALDAPAPETPISGKAVRGAGGIINGAVETFGPTGAAAAFVALGIAMAILSAAVCPSPRQ